MVGLRSRIVGDLNWSIAIVVSKVRSEPSRSRLGLLRSEMVDRKKF